MQAYVEHFIELLKAAPGEDSEKYIKEIDGESSRPFLLLTFSSLLDEGGEKGDEGVDT